MADVTLPLIYDATAVTEDVEVVPNLAINLYDGVAVAEYTPVTVIDFFRLNESIPFWGLTAEFDRTFQLDEKLPTYSVAGYFGSKLDSVVAARTLVGTFEQESVGLNVRSNLPTGSVEGQFGFRLDVRIPVSSLESLSGFDSTLQLSSKIPLRTVAGTIYGEGTLQLVGAIPPRTLVGGLEVSEDKLTLSAKIPGALKFTGSFLWEETFSLSATIPFWDLEATIYSGELVLDSNIPVWMIDAVMDETKPFVDADSSVTDDSFVGVLRYIRP